jgi:hypothetical protein
MTHFEVKRNDYTFWEVREKVVANKVIHGRTVCVFFRRKYASQAAKALNHIVTQDGKESKWTRKQ